MRTEFYVGCALLMLVAGIVIGLVVYALGFVLAIAALAIAVALTGLLHAGLMLTRY